MTMPPSKNISFDELSKYFHLPINQVAKELGVCATILKKICRRNGIPRWPHRKIKSLDKMIANLNMNLEKNPQERDDIVREIELLKSKKLEIMKNPDILVGKGIIPITSSASLLSDNEFPTKSSPSKITSPRYRLHDGTPYAYKQTELETAEALNCFAPPFQVNKEKRSFEVATEQQQHQVPQQPVQQPVKTETNLQFKPMMPHNAMELPNLMFDMSRHSYASPAPSTTAPNPLGLPPGVTHNFMVPSMDFQSYPAPMQLPNIHFEPKYANRCLPPIAADRLLSVENKTIRQGYPVPPVLSSLPEWFNQEKDRVLKNST